MHNQAINLSPDSPASCAIINIIIIILKIVQNLNLTCDIWQLTLCKLDLLNSLLGTKTVLNVTLAMYQVKYLSHCIHFQSRHYPLPLCLKYLWPLCQSLGTYTWNLLSYYNQNSGHHRPLIGQKLGLINFQIHTIVDRTQFAVS